MAQFVKESTKLEFVLTLTNGEETTTRKLSFDSPKATASIQADAIALARKFTSDAVLAEVDASITEEVAMPTWNTLIQPANWRDASSEVDPDRAWTCTKCEWQVVTTTTTWWTED